METRSHLEQTAAKAGSVDRTKMQIANQHGTAAAPRCRQIRKFERNAADANDASIDNAIDAGKCGEREQNLKQNRANRGWIRRKRREAQREPRQANENRCLEEKVEKAEPRSSKRIENVDGKIGESKRNQRGRDEGERQNKHGDSQIGDGCGRQAGPKGNAGGINQPMAEKKNALDEENGEDWPGFQTGSPCIHDCMRGAGLHPPVLRAKARETIKV
ncbi:MAG: hypothetical protein WBP71_09850 [Terracidiphilus sp.]